MAEAVSQALTSDLIETLRSRASTAAAAAITEQVESTLNTGTELDEKATRLVEMPAAHSYDNFVEWTAKRAKNSPYSLKKGADLNRRIYELQPLPRYQGPGVHPLKLPQRPEAAIAVGEVVFTAPSGPGGPGDTVPDSRDQHPGHRSWPVLMNELDELASWIRKRAIPRLITGADPQGTPFSGS